MAHLHAFGAGLLFGIGLWVSGMANPKKVLDFLDVTGNWDPSLLLVMGGAVMVTLIGFRPLKGKISIDKTKVDAPLVLGAAIFGIGWGIGGYCPGPRGHRDRRARQRHIGVRGGDDRRGNPC